MQQGSDYTSSLPYYPQQYPNNNNNNYPPPPPPLLPPNPIDPHSPSPYASAPPQHHHQPPQPSDYPNSYPHNYPPFPHSISPPSAPPPHYLSPDPYSPPAPASTTSYYPPPYEYDQPPPPQNYSAPTPSSYSAPPVYENAPKYDYTSGGSAHASGYFDDNLTSYGGYPSVPRTNSASGNYDSYKDDGVYAYTGKSEPYGARGTSAKSSAWSGMFDDYGRAISSSPPRSEKKASSSLKVVKAVPKVDSSVDSKGGVQKFRVKLLPESGGQGVMDVLCTVGLDGIRMLDPSSSRTLRIYPLDTVTRCDKIDSSTFAFWSKTSVDIEPRRIRLQSNSYTTNTILDTVTAATVQFKEMGGRIRPSEALKASEQAAEKKKGITDWINKLKPLNEEKDHWVPDEAVAKCTGCGSDFSAFNRRHHCRNCGDIFCDKCTPGRTPLTAEDNAPAVRVCDRCMAEVSQRLSKAKDAASRPVSLHSHEDLAKKLQEEMERNLKISSGSKSEGSGKRMREVACPTCTVHLQVQVPSSGSETIECGVCQHPFLVSAH